MTLLWATRGRTWGFRFLRDGGFPDPLPVYERVFAETGEDPEAFCRAGEMIGLRFPDPLGRKDEVGRVIPHEIVALKRESAGVDTVEAGVRILWPLVADEFAQVWELPEPPTDRG